MTTRLAPSPSSARSVRLTKPLAERIRRASISRACGPSAIRVRRLAQPSPTKVSTIEAWASASSAIAAGRWSALRRSRHGRSGRGPAARGRGRAAASSRRGRRAGQAHDRRPRPSTGPIRAGRGGSCGASKPAVDEEQPRPVAVEPGQSLRRRSRRRARGQLRKRRKVAPAPAFRLGRGEIEKHQTAASP